MSVKIVVDSAANVSEAVRQQVITIPMMVSFGDEEYLDGVTIDHNSFYEKLAQNQHLPKTSQIPPVKYEEYFEQIVSAGDTAVVLTLSSKFSGTYQSAMIAAEAYQGKIFVVDSLAATLSIGIMAEYALRLVDSGCSAEKIAQEIEQIRQRVCLVAVLDTLEYLQKGGRVSKVMAYAGALLQIKPVISVVNSKIKVIDKARGVKMGYKMLSSNIEKLGGVDFDMPVLFGYTGLSDQLLQGYLQESEQIWQEVEKPLPVSGVGSIIGTHAGPDAYAVAFFTKQL